ncbi:MAG: hypothetical protein HFI09_02505 [Bacilli bacterium]|nr:hypothetical protein [Bacilli bacterium]
MTKNNEKVLKKEWIIALSIFALCFLIFLYGDILITTNTSITFDKLLFQGKLYHLYEASYKTFGGILLDSYITYDFPIYIFFGIWNLPLLILTKITGFYWVESYGAILYAKLFLVALMIILFKVMKKIINHFKLSQEDNKMYQYLFISSSLTIMVIAMFAGYDILSLVFTMLGIYYYLKDDLPKFTLFFAIAISVKLFALLIFIPLLLLKEKNIGKIIGYSLLAISLVIIPKIIYRNAPMYQISMNSFENNMMNKLNLSYLITPFGNTSIFTTLYVLICCFCYGKNISEKKLIDLYTMYIPFVVYGLFAIFCEVHPQWVILLIPFLIFFLVYNKENRKTNILIESVFSASFLYLLYQIYYWVFSPNLMNIMIGEFIPQKNGVTTLPILEQFKNYNSLFGGAALALLLYLFWINRPEKLLKQEQKEKWCHWLLMARSCIIVPFAAIIIYYYFR